MIPCESYLHECALDMTIDTMTQPKTARRLVLPGGGARGAFQVGVLKAIAEMLPKAQQSVLGDQRHIGRRRLIRWCWPARHSGFAWPWRSWNVSGVIFAVTRSIETDNHDAEEQPALAGVDRARRMPGRRAESLLDNAPLRALLSRNVTFPAHSGCDREGFS